MSADIRHYILKLLRDIVSLDQDIIILFVIIVCSVIVLDAVTLYTRRKRKEAGIQKKTTTVSIDGSKTLPVRDYISDIQGLAGRPDALINENGFIIPIERKPLAKKIRDRYIAQLLVYMRLIEEFEGKRPPYGYLILGANCRRIKIENTEDRQAWLQKMLDDMRGILDNTKVAAASPHQKKCQKCSVRNSCSQRADAPSSSKILSKSPALSKTAV